MLIDEQIEAAMKARRAEFTYPHALQIFTCTWNVGNCTPYAEQVYSDILRWLFINDQDNAASAVGHEDGCPPAGSQARDHDEGSAVLCNADLVVIALQEVVNLDNPYNLTYLGDFSTRQYCT
jgi:hypothetical protein